MTPVRFHAHSSHTQHHHTFYELNYRVIPLNYRVIYRVLLTEDITSLCGGEVELLRVMFINKVYGWQSYKQDVLMYYLV